MPRFTPCHYVPVDGTPPTVAEWHDVLQKLVVQENFVCTNSTFEGPGLALEM